MTEQTEPIRQRVAVRGIKLGMNTRQVVAPFPAERQALALMDYSDIAEVLDVSATKTERTWFVMEPVRGAHQPAQGAKPRWGKKSVALLASRHYERNCVATGPCNSGGDYWGLGLSGSNSK